MPQHRMLVGTQSASPRIDQSDEHPQTRNEAAVAGVSHGHRDVKILVSRLKPDELRCRPLICPLSRADGVTDLVITAIALATIGRDAGAKMLEGLPVSIALSTREMQITLRPLLRVGTDRTAALFSENQPVIRRAFRHSSNSLHFRLGPNTSTADVLCVVVVGVAALGDQPVS